jgi:hypothetical protein
MRKQRVSRIYENAADLEQTLKSGCMAGFFAFSH